MAHKITKQLEAAEAVCGALYAVDFEYMYETDGGASTWFRRGEKPKRVVVEVQRSRLAPYVLVNIEYFNISIPGQTIRGRIVCQIDCRSGAKDADIHEATQKAVVSCLETLRDVVAGEGVAGRAALSHLKFD